MKMVEIISYTEKYREAWDRFVLQSNNGTMFHLQRFLDYHAPEKFRFHHLLFVEKGKIVAVLPGRFKDGIFESPIGASYGSIVIDDIPFARVMELVSCFLDYARNCLLYPDRCGAWAGTAALQYGRGSP